MLYRSWPPLLVSCGKITRCTVDFSKPFVQYERRSPILIKIGGRGSISVPDGVMGTGDQVEVGVKISRPAGSAAGREG